MKKTLIVAGLTGAMVLSGAGMVMAGGPGRAEGFRACEQAGGSEEVLVLRQERLDAMVESGMIDQDRANDFAAAMQERQADCDGTAVCSEGRERLGMRLGRPEEGRGEFRGAGNGEGRRGEGQNRNRTGDR